MIGTAWSSQLADEAPLVRLVPVITVFSSFLTFVASAIGTTSAILLGWRTERRPSVGGIQAKNSQLELQLQDAQAKSVLPAKDTWDHFDFVISNSSPV
jgi:hypothetical protein